MPQELKFDPVKVDEIDRFISQIEIKPSVVRQINQIGIYFGKNLPLKERTIQGLVTLALIDFYPKNEFPINKTGTLLEDIIKKNGIYFSTLFYREASATLTNPNQRKLLKQAIQDAISKSISIPSPN